jgi:hypothetical protein
MKKNILYILFILTTIGSFSLAQTTQNGSRLNMGTSKKASADNLKLNTFPVVLNYKPLSLKNPKALNSFYRTLFFANNAEIEKGVAVYTDNSESFIEKKAIAPESNRKSEEQLFSNELISVSNIYPNPASDYAELDYTIQPSVREAKVVIYSILGAQMDVYDLRKSEKKLLVNTREMPTGLYFYQLSLDGKKVATKKMLVRHQQ